MPRGRGGYFDRENNGRFGDREEGSGRGRGGRFDDRGGDRSFQPRRDDERRQNDRRPDDRRRDDRRQDDRRPDDRRQDDRRRDDRYPDDRRRQDDRRQDDRRPDERRPDDRRGPLHDRTQERNSRGGRGGRNNRKAKNTENFSPCHDATDMRIVVEANPNRYTLPIQTRDVVMAPCVFNRPGDAKLYDQLVAEVQKCGVPEKDLLMSWHGDTHWIANDSTGWKKNCPVFMSCVDRLKQYFNMDIKATRFNWYKDTSEWKPYHHDAAAVKPDKAKTQNFTVAVSFGATREASFEEVDSKKTVSVVLPHGSVYCFARDVNIMWKHGILQVPPEQQRDEGRISIIAWGWLPEVEVGKAPALLC